MELKTVVSMFFPALLAGAITAGAQDSYPSRPVQLVTTISAGMTSDILARMFADKLTQRLGQPVIVQNKPGAGGTIATQAVAGAAPDGYTLLMINVGHSLNPFLYRNLPYDGLRDFAGVVLFAESPLVVLVNPQLGVRTLKEFIALAKQKPGTIYYPSAGVGTVTHLGGAYFASLAGIDLVHVPYKAMSAIIADLISGRVQAAFFPPAMLSNFQGGKLLALAVSSTEPLREPVVLPTAREAANLDYVMSNWSGIVAPAKTPVPILERLSRAIQEIAVEEDVKARYKTLGLALRIVALRDFDAFMKADMERLGPVVKASGATAN